MAEKIQIQWAVHFFQLLQSPYAPHEKELKHSIVQYLVTTE